MKVVDITGLKFGCLTPIKRCGSKQTKNGATALWECLCDCGSSGVFEGTKLRNGNTKSCGCLKKKAGDQTRTHGKSNTKAYELWAAMIQRAKGNRAKSYVDLGIGVCERWQSFENFYADMGDPPEGYSLERIDNFGDYEPTNCKWIPLKDQWRNRRTTRLVEFGGELMSPREIGERIGMSIGRVKRRITTLGGKHVFTG